MNTLLIVLMVTAAVLVFVSGLWVGIALFKELFHRS